MAATSFGLHPPEPLQLQQGNTALNDDPYIEKSKAKLTMYNGAVMYPVGKCKLKCTRDGSSHGLEFQVVDGDV